MAPARLGTTCLLYAIGDGETIDSAPDHCIAQTGGSGARHKLTQGQDAALKIEASNDEFYRFYHQSMEDMAALRLPIEGTDHLEFVPAAGIPWFVALFGRDSLIVSLQTAMVYPGLRPRRSGGVESLSGQRAGRPARRRTRQNHA